MKQMLKSKLKDMPESEQEKILAVVEKNPELFMKIAREVEEKTKQGKDQMTAAMEVMKNYESELRGILK